MTETAPRTVRVAAVQFDPDFADKASNLDRLLRLTDEAASQGARLIVHTEMATAGYCWLNRQEIAPLVEPIPGPTTERFATLARRRDCVIVLGMPEVAPDTGIFYNSAAVIGPEGLLGVYRKTHSFISEPKWAKDGDLGLPVFDSPAGRLGVLICADAVYPETARLLALQGAELLCFPTNWLEPAVPPALWSARALENGLPLIAANRSGQERDIAFPGASTILGHDGRLLARSTGRDEVIVADIDLAASAAAGRIAERRPELYDTLTLNTYLHNPLEFHGLYGHRPLPAGRCSQVAVVQYEPVSGDPETNLARIRDILAGAATPLDLIVLPHYALTGRPADANVARELANQGLDQLIRLAREQSCVVAAGLIETEGSALFPSAVLVEPDGRLTRYRATHPTTAERAWCQPGDCRPPIVDLPLGRVGLLLGDELRLPEPARTLAIEGCDLLAAPSAGDWLAVPGDDPALAHVHLARVRATENNCYLAVAALAAPSGAGRSGIFGPGYADRDATRELPPEASGLTVRRIDTSDPQPGPPTNPVRAKEALRRRQAIFYDLLQAPLNGGNRSCPGDR